MMKLSIFGRLKLADVLGGGTLMKLVFPGILYLICIFLLFLRKYNFMAIKSHTFCSRKSLMFICDLIVEINQW